MSDQEAKELLLKYEAGNCTDIEKALVEQWLFQFNQEPVGWSDERLTALKQEVWQQLQQRQVKQISWWPRIAVAASILLCLSVGFYFIGYRDTEVTKPNLQAASVLPGGNKAILTLGNGKQIVLTDTKNGQLAAEGGAAIDKTADGNLVYHSAQSDRVNDALAYNTMTTPKGGQYHLTLADGTGVWLNAASSIKYPTTFTGNERHVEITGEAYFEVTHNAQKPFKVLAQNQTVEVLGTHFNINAYADEPAIKTTLLEGSVKVTAAMASAVIKPGEQAVLHNDQLGISETNTEEAVAWKNGYFRFNGEKITSIMRKLSRWYNIDVSYDGATSDEEYTAAISRYRNINEVLRELAYSKSVHFKIEGRRVTVMQ